jgi:hypothetical protein
MSKGAPAPMRAELPPTCGVAAAGVAERMRLVVEEGQMMGSSARAFAASIRNGPAITRAQYRRDVEPERSMSARIIITYA